MKEHPSTKYNKHGVLLVNLGTPDTPDFLSIRRYLKEFLSDRRVIEVNPIVWWCVLNFIILNIRPQKIAHSYKAIWKKDTNESPLRYFTRQQASKLQQEIKTKNVIVEWAMRYGRPSIKEKISVLVNKGCQTIDILPLYPQYSATTTATVCDEVYRTVMKMRWQPTVNIVKPYHDNPDYIRALAISIKKHLKSLSWKPDVILASFHGLPKKYFEKGDPYYCFCHKTTRLLREELGTDEDTLTLTFQSRFGRQEWLQPYTDKMVEELAKKGKKNIAIIAPGFASDCLETLEEISIEIKETFVKCGGKNFTYIPCLNDSKEHIDLLVSLLPKIQATHT